VRNQSFFYNHNIEDQLDKPYHSLVSGKNASNQADSSRILIGFAKLTSQLEERAFSASPCKAFAVIAIKGVQWNSEAFPDLKPRATS
jgi:hypothetical protein